MISKTLTRFLVLIAVLIGQLGVYAQQVSAVKASVQFRTFGWQVADLELFYDLGGKDVPVEIIDSTRSRFYDFAGPKPTIFYRLITDAVGKKVREPVASVDMSNAGSRPLLVFMPDKTSGTGTVRIVPIADDTNSFPSSHFRFVNFTPIQLGVTLGQDRVVLPANDFRQIDPKLDPNEPSSTRYCVLSAATADGPKTLYASNWAALRNQRTLVLIFAENSTLRVTRVIDDPNDYTPQPAAAP